MRNIIKTGIFNLVLSATTITSAIFIQLRGQKSVDGRCSYLDPIAIDILAFIAAFFLVIEGTYKIVQNRDVSWKKQIGRSVRIAFGCSILTLHIMQVMTKYKLF